MPEQNFGGGKWGWILVHFISFNPCSNLKREITVFIYILHIMKVRHEEVSKLFKVTQVIVARAGIKRKSTCLQRS